MYPLCTFWEVKMYKSISLEMSLKPFKKTDDAYIRRTAEKVFCQWYPLLKDAREISVMLWTADGSEILDYKGREDDELEWAKYVGIANRITDWNKEIDPDGKWLHTRNYDYIENPPTLRYKDLKRIISALKEAGKRILRIDKILVGATFDPGPEFAKSEFKYKRHHEICGGVSMGKNSMVCCYGILKGDSETYAGYPDGIPSGTPVGTFLGRQSKLFCEDMGFDFLWLSNGFGFGSETWGTTGSVFDGENFHPENLEDSRTNILKFWDYFRKECPYLPLETRGTNLSVGIDIATDGVPLKSIYEGGYHMFPPPNSPWAALDGDFGLELSGFLSRISELPGEDFMFRYYIHDPWWVNSPWYDRYEGQPHDIYLPTSVSRMDKRGALHTASRLNLLTIDNSFGEMPEACVYEPLPHLLKAKKEAPDAPGPLIWIYPFDEYHSCRSAEELSDAFFEDWYIRGAINQGLPLNTVISTRSFLALEHAAGALKGAVLVSTVPRKDSFYEKKLFELIDGGQKVIFYGNVNRAGSRFLDMLGLTLCDEISGVLPVSYESNDQFTDGSYPTLLNHRPMTCGGGINTRSTGLEITKSLASSGNHILGLSAGHVAWLRGSCTSAYKKGAHILQPDDYKKYFAAEKLMRYALSHLGYDIRFRTSGSEAKTPVLTIHRYDNAFMFSTYARDTTAETLLKFPLGAPLLLGYETILENGYSCYHLPRAEHRECRAFITQESGKIICREIPPISYQVRRRIQIEGLVNARVCFYPEKYCEENIEVIQNAGEPYYVGEKPCGEWKSDGSVRYLEVEDVTGTILFSMPSKNQTKK